MSRTCDYSLPIAVSFCDVPSWFVGLHGPKIEAEDKTGVLTVHSRYHEATRDHAEESAWKDAEQLCDQLDIPFLRSEWDFCNVRIIEGN